MNDRESVWEGVEQFRHEHLGTRADFLPVDVFTLIEIDLKLDVIPFDDLLEKYSVDAALMQDFSGIYVDAESYIYLDEGPRWKQYRLRFSVAHELGHYVLHRELAEAQKFTTFAQFCEWIRNSEGDKYSLEQSANEFAGRFLVPRGRLTEQLAKMKEKFEAVMPEWRGSHDLQQSFCKQVNDRYMVNPEVIRMRLERERLWIVS